MVVKPEMNNISQISQPSFDSPLNRSLITSRIVPSVDHSVLDDLDVRPLSSLKSSFIDKPSEQDSLNVTVEEGTVSGISTAAEAAEAAEDGAVYTMDGRLVRNDGSLEGLPKGVYVKGGKKYVVK